MRAIPSAEDRDWLVYAGAVDEKEDNESQCRLLEKRSSEVKAFERGPRGDDPTDFMRRAKEEAQRTY